MKRVVCFGSFDILHKGHLYYFQEAKKQGDSLIVVVARDDTIRFVKKREPVFSQEERVEILRALDFIDEAVLGKEYSANKLKVIEEIKPDVICLGYDQDVNEDKLKKDLEKRGLNVKVKRLGSYKPEVYKSSFIRQNLMRGDQV